MTASAAGASSVALARTCARGVCPVRSTGVPCWVIMTWKELRSPARTPLRCTTAGPRLRVAVIGFLPFVSGRSVHDRHPTDPGCQDLHGGRTGPVPAGGVPGQFRDG